MSRAKKLARRAALALSSPAAAGAFFFLAVHFATPRPRQFASLNETQADVVERHGALIAITWLLVLAAHLVLGAASGVAASAILRAWDAALARTPSRARRFGETIALVALALAWALASTLVAYPQIFAAWLYDRGGAPRALEVGLTENVSPFFLEVAGASLLALLVLGPLFFGRGRDAARKSARAILAVFPSKKRRAAFASILAFAVVSTLVAGSGKTTPRTDARPNVLVLGVDSLRADRVGNPLFPRISGLCERGVVFRQARVSLPLTFPSLTTLLAGRFPQHHGIRHMFPGRRAREGVGPTIATHLAARGWRTAFAIDEGLDPLTTLDLGFESARRDGMSVEPLLVQALVGRELALLPLTTTESARRALPALQRDWSCFDPDRVASRVIGELDERGGRPFFVFGFFAATHFPYASPWPFYRRCGKRGYEGPYRYHVPAMGPSWPLGEAERERIRGLYDGAVLATDAAIGRVLDAVSRRGLERRTIVVLLADHGENLAEFGRGLGHSDHLRGEDALRVPLVVLDPVHGFAPHEVAGIVRDVDLAPTLGQLAGEPLPGADGVDLSPLLRGERDDLGLEACSESSLVFSSSELVRGEERFSLPDYPAFLTLDGDEVVLDPALEELAVFVKERAIRSGKWKLLYTPTRSGARYELFDLAADPEERFSVAATNESVVGELRGKLEAWMRLDGSVVGEGGLVLPREGFVPPR